MPDYRTIMIKILIVEDEEKIARFIELELVHEGYKVIKVNNTSWSVCYIKLL